MGRPVNKKHFGIVSGSDNNFVVTVKVGTNAVSAVGIIKRQRGSNKFMVDDANDAVSYTHLTLPTILLV